MTDDSFRPRRRPDIRTESVAGELVLYDAAGGRAAYLNPTAAAIWALCDGQRTVAEMVDYLSREIGGEAIGRDVPDTIDRFRTAGLVA
jgi:hypothetical protein